MWDCQLFGLKPWGHHLTSVLLHAANGVLVFLVFRRMTGAFWRCAVLALLFALHPLRVESVTWISERKDVLSTVFWLLTLLMYVRYAERPVVSNQCSVTSSQASGAPATGYGRRTTNCRSLITDPRSLFYLLSLLCFALGLMSKPMLVTLPFVLLLLDYWPLNRFELKTQDSRLKTLLPLLREKLPFFALAGVFVMITFLVQRTAGALETGMPLDTRVANALVSYLRYAGKLFWPADLSVFYPYPQQWPVWTVMASAALLVAAFAVTVMVARRRPYLAVGWLWFCGTLMPVIGLVQVGDQSMADRYSYVPSIGLLMMVIWGAQESFPRWHSRAVLLAAAAAVAVLCGALTRRQISYWKDTESLFGHALAVTRNNDVAHFNLGVALAMKGAFTEAAAHYAEAVRINPRADDAHSGLAYCLARQHRFSEAVQHYEVSLRLKPDDAEAHNNLGNLLARQGRVNEAIPHYREALRLAPNHAEAHFNLGLGLATQGRYAEAADQFREVLRRRPDFPGGRQKLERALAAGEEFEQAVAPYRETLRSSPGDARAHAELGRLLLEAGQLDEALIHLAEAARLEPKNAEVQYQLGAALARQRETEQAGRQFELALELDPKLAAAHQALGMVRQQQGQVPEALKHWQEAARLAPRWPDPLDSVAWALATDSRAGVRNGPEAVELAERAVELSGTNNVGMLDTLAAAYAEGGRFAEAAATARRAQAMAAAQGQDVLAGQIGQRLALYEANQPYRQVPEPDKSATSAP